ncbi:MAG: ABC transporter ATP-binding protein [bacterium]
MIELKNVSKKFGNKTAVDGVSFEVKKGEIIGFLGPNAAGKTTTMRMITGFLSPTQGEVIVAGIDMSKSPLAAKAKIGYMPENVPLYKEMEVYAYLKFIAEIKGVKKNIMEERIKKCMEETGLMSVTRSIIGKLSKGYKQRVGLAQAILNDPEVLVLDEPTVGLDPKQIKEIRTLIKNMKGQRTIILSTHILPEVAMTCDRVIVINEGKIVAQDEVKNLTDSYSKAMRIYLEVAAPKNELIKEIKKIKGIEEIKEESNTAENIYSYVITTDGKEDLRREITTKIVKHKWGLLEFKRQQMSLEDVFLRLVTKEDL